MDKEKNIILIETVFLCFYRSSHISTRATISVLKGMLYFSQTFIFLSILLDCEFQEDRVSTLFNITKFSIEFVLFLLNILLHDFNTAHKHSISDCLIVHLIYSHKLSLWQWRLYNLIIYKKKFALNHFPH